MKTIRYFSSIVALLVLAVATSCSDSDAIKSIEDEVTHTATMTLSGGVRGFDDSRADAEGWSDGDRLYLNFSTNNGAVSGVATYNKSIDSWNVTYSGTLTEGAATKCEAYFFDGETSLSGTDVTFNALTAVYADKSAYYVCKDGAISLTAVLVPQSARFRFKGTPGTEFSVSGCESYTGFSSQSLRQSSTNIEMKIADDGYSPYIYGFLADDNNTLVVTNGDYDFLRKVNNSNLAFGKSGWFLLPTESSYAGWEMNELPYRIYNVNGVSFKMIKVKAGTFMMGATEEEDLYGGKPAHQVTLTKDYYIGETEVTQALWSAVIGQDSGWNTYLGLGENYPAYCISWIDCQRFITKLNQLTGLSFRLPTEAEWEYAARGGHKATFQTIYSGSNSIDDVAWWDGNSSTPQIVALKAPNALGLYDMSGNVDEHCYDLYEDYSSNSQTDPIGVSSEHRNLRVCRGGDYCIVRELALSVTNRSTMNEDSSYGAGRNGMRLALGEVLPDLEPDYEPIPDPVPDPEHEPYETIKNITVIGVSLKMRLVEAGTFIMGATSEQIGAIPDEFPAHQVTLTKDFYMGETEVTQALWYAVMGQKPITLDGMTWYENKGLGDNYPAYYISWNDCQKFISKLNQLTGLTFRLPTEAEWEYAARGGNKATTQTLYSGSNIIDDVCDGSNLIIHEVAEKAANALGLYDMSGNLYEWCYDKYGSYSNCPQTDPMGVENGPCRVLRGGRNGWAPFCRVSARFLNTYLNNHDYNENGMRLALTAY